jgi:hypothetical protein
MRILKPQVEQANTREDYDSRVRAICGFLKWSITQVGAASFLCI